LFILTSQVQQKKCIKRNVYVLVNETDIFFYFLNKFILHICYVLYHSNMKSFLSFLVGISLGLWFSWPGILFPEKWQCFQDIVSKSSDKKLSVKAALAISPKYFLKQNKNNIFLKIRIVSDACFR